MNSAQGSGEQPPTTLTFLRPSSSTQTQARLDQLHELLQVMHTWRVDDIDAKEKRERLVELTGMCLVGMLTYGGKKSFERSERVRAWVKLAASHSETLLKRGESLGEKDLDLMNDISILRTLPAEVSKIPPTSTPTTVTQPKAVARSAQPEERVLSSDAHEKQSAPSHDHGTDQNDEALSSYSGLKRRSDTSVTMVEDGIGGGRSKRPRFEVGTERHEEGERGDGGNGAVAGAEFSTPGAGGSRQSPAERVAPKGIYRPPCSRCAKQGRTCNYIAVGRAFSQCRALKAKCSLARKASRVTTDGEGGATKVENGLTETKPGVPEAEHSGQLEDGAYDRQESVGGVDVAPGIEEMRIVPGTTNFAAERIPPSLPEERPEGGDIVSAGSHSPDIRRLPTFNLRRFSQRHQGKLEQKKADEERRKAVKDKEKVDNERIKAEKKMKKAEREAKLSDRRAHALRTLLMAAETAGSPLYTLDGRKVVAPSLRLPPVVGGSTVSPPEPSPGTHALIPTPAQPGRCCSIISATPTHSHRLDIASPATDDPPLEPVNTYASLDTWPSPGAEGLSERPSQLRAQAHGQLAASAAVVRPSPHTGPIEQRDLHQIFDGLLIRMNSIQEVASSIQMKASGRRHGCGPHFSLARTSSQPLYA